MWTLHNLCLYHMFNNYKLAFNIILFQSRIWNMMSMGINKKWYSIQKVLTAFHFRKIQDWTKNPRNVKTKTEGEKEEKRIKWKKTEQYLIKLQQGYCHTGIWRANEKIESIQHVLYNGIMQILTFQIKEANSKNIIMARKSFLKWRVYPLVITP